MPGLLQTPDAQFGEVKFALAVVAELLGMHFFHKLSAVSGVAHYAKLLFGRCPWRLMLQATLVF